MKAAGMREVLRNRPFRLLTLGIAASRTGDAMTFVVITWLALGIGGPRAVGLVVFATGCVTPLSAPIVGYLVDRLGLRRLMLVDNLSRGALMAVLAVVVGSGQARVEYLVGFAIVSAALAPATELGQSVAVPELLTASQLDAGNRLLSASWDVAAWIGPAVAGFGLDLVGATPVLLVDAGTFLVMALVALAMPGRPEHPEDPAGRSTAARLFSGFALLWRIRPAAILTLVTVGDLFLGGMMEVFLPAFNKLTLHHGAGAYGLLMSISGITCLIGTLTLSPLVTRLGQGPGLVLVLVARGIAVLPLAFVGSWAVVAAVVGIAAFPDGGFFPIVRTMQQQLVPAGVRGRVQGAKATLGVAGFPLGSAVCGVLVAALGAPPVALVMGLGYLPLALIVLLTPRLRRHHPTTVDTQWKNDEKEERWDPVSS